MFGKATTEIWSKIRPYRFGIAAAALSSSLQLMGFTNQTLGAILLALSVVLFLSPVLEHLAGISLSFDRYPKVPKKKKTVLVLNEPISHLLAVVFVGLAVYAVAFSGQRSVSISIQVTPQGEEAPEDAANLTLIRGKSFHDEPVILDGHRYVGCTFSRVEFQYDGGYYEILDSKLDLCCIGVTSRNQAIIRVMDLLHRLQLLPADVKSDVYYPGEKVPFLPFGKKNFPS